VRVVCVLCACVTAIRSPGLDSLASFGGHDAHVDKASGAYCNRLQQTATDCNRLQQTATD